MRTYIILRQLRLIVKKNNKRVFRMKNKIFLTSLFFVLMAVLPMGFISNIGDTEPKTHAAPNSDYKRYISKAAEYCDNSFCGEALKAIAIIARTNCKSGAELPSEANDNSDSELYERLENYFKDGATVLYSENKPVEIPICKCTSGFTSASEKHDYLSPVASPWDVFSAEQEKAGGFSGVSAAGIDYLCKNGMKAEEALKWYLPKLRIM